MSNHLPESKQVAVLSALVEGCSIRSTSRMTDVSQPTILSLLVRVGEGCGALLDTTMRDLTSTRVECDEIWSFVQKKQRHVTESDDAALVGDTWTFVAFDPDSKLVASHLVGKRTAETRLTNAFSKKLRNHRAATALHFAHYNLCRIHGSIRVTPAVEAGIASRVWSMTDLLNASLHGERP